MTTQPGTNTDTEAAYEPGDTVRIVIPDDDIDSDYTGTECEVIDNTPDDLHKLTGVEHDKHHYKLRTIDTEEVLPVRFRHHDLTAIDAD